MTLDDEWTLLRCSSRCSSVTYSQVCSLVTLRRPQFSWTRIKGESDVKGGGGHGSVEEGAGRVNDFETT